MVERYVEAASGCGVTELAFTEHLYRCVEAAPVLGEWWEREPDGEPARQTRARIDTERFLSLEHYVDLVLGARDAGLPVLLGLEVDFFPDTIDAVMEFLAPYPWDLLVGSVHWIGAWAFDQWDTDGEWDRRGNRTTYEQYFELETALAASGTVDVLAHPDRCKLRGRRPPQEPVDLYRRLVEAAVGSGVAIEVSSAGLRHPVREIYPAPTLLRMCREAGLGITLASDAHVAEQAGWKTNEIRSAAMAAGYTRVERFRGRHRSSVPLEPAREGTGSE